MMKRWIHLRTFDDQAIWEISENQNIVRNKQDDEHIWQKRKFVSYYIES